MHYLISDQLDQKQCPYIEHRDKTRCVGVFIYLTRNKNSFVSRRCMAEYISIRGYFCYQHENDLINMHCDKTLPNLHTLMFVLQYDVKQFTDIYTDLIAECYLQFGFNDNEAYYIVTWCWHRGTLGELNLYFQYRDDFDHIVVIDDLMISNTLWFSFDVLIAGNGSLSLMRQNMFDQIKW